MEHHKVAHFKGKLLALLANQNFFKEKHSSLFSTLSVGLYYKTFYGGT
jgi:hypothetical protein